MTSDHDSTAVEIAVGQGTLTEIWQKATRQLNQLNDPNQSIKLPQSIKITPIRMTPINQNKPNQSIKNLLFV